MRRRKAATRHSLEQDGFGTGFPWAFGLLSAVGSRCLEHRGQDADPAFHEISSQVGSKLSEVRPHRHAEIRRRRQPRLTTPYRTKKPPTPNPSTPLSFP